MKTLMAILSYEKANAMVERHWGFYLNAGCDLVGIGRANSNVRFPHGIIARHNIGQDTYVKGDNLPRLVVDAFEYLLGYDGYTHVCLIEPDVLFFEPLSPLPRGLLGIHAGHGSPGFHGSFYFHPPWCADIETAKKIVTCGERMLRCGLIEQGFPDRFLGLLCDLYDLPAAPFIRAFTRNTIHPNTEDERLLLKRVAEDQLHVCHGVKDPPVLDNIYKALERPITPMPK